jgi:hypothetical protein
VVIDVLAGLQFVGVDLWQIMRSRAGQIKAAVLQKGATVVGKPPERTLPQVKIKGADLVTHPGQGRCDVHGNRGFPCAAFFVSDDDNMRHSQLSLIFPQLSARSLWQ